MTQITIQINWIEMFIRSFFFFVCVWTIFCFIEKWIGNSLSVFYIESHKRKARLLFLCVKQGSNVLRHSNLHAGNWSKLCHPRIEKKKHKQNRCILYKVVLKIYTQINSDQRNFFKLMTMCLDLHYQINNEKENKLLKPKNESLHLDTWSKCVRASFYY
jgi:hypothetical protein